MRLSTFVLSTSLLLGATNLGAANVAGVTIEDKVTVNNQTLLLNGAALRKKFVVKVYVGALYLPAKSGNATSIIATDQPRRMVLHFLYAVSKDQMADAWAEGLEGNTPNASPEVKTAFKTLASWMENMKEEQRIVMTYVPGIGTTVEVNGKSKGTLGGKAVADAILSTWIGPKPGPGGDFKKGILGQ